MKLVTATVLIFTLQGCAASDTILKDQYRRGFNECKAEDTDAFQYILGQAEILQSIVNEQASEIRRLKEQLSQCTK